MARPPQDAEYLKTLAPSQLLAEKGSDLVVICPGSAYLKIGLATAPSPSEVPHFIAQYYRSSDVSGTDNLASKGSIQKWKESAHQERERTATHNEDRRQAWRQVEEELHLTVRSEGRPKWSSGLAPATSVSLLSTDDVDFSWTETTVFGAMENLADVAAKGLGDTTEPSIWPVETGGAVQQHRDSPLDDQGDTVIQGGQAQGCGDTVLAQDMQVNQPITVEPATATKQDMSTIRSEALAAEAAKLVRKLPSAVNGTQGTGTLARQAPNLTVAEVAGCKPYFCGEEATRIAAGEPYRLRRPIRRGHLNASEGYPLQQVVMDLAAIWGWALTHKLGLKLSDCGQLSAILVAPDTLDSREIKELVNLLFVEFHFLGVIVHQECVAAAFGSAVSSACIVNMGAQVISIGCVEDGVLLPGTQRTLPFGSEDLARCCLWIQEQNSGPLHPSFDADKDYMDFAMLEDIKNTHCALLEGDQQADVEIKVRTRGQPTQVYRSTLTAAINVAPMSLFHPMLLAGQLEPAPSPHFRLEHEDTIEGFLQAELGAVRRTEAAEANDGGTSTPAPGAQMSTAVQGSNTGAHGPSARAAESPLVGLHLAIVQSILSLIPLGRTDLVTRLFTSLHLIGGGAQVKGLVDFVEERYVIRLKEGHILQALPGPDRSYGKVLASRYPTTQVSWKGGAVLGVLESARDQWLQRDDWLAGGIKVGSAKKYRDSTTQQTQLNWYSGVQE